MRLSVGNDRYTLSYTLSFSSLLLSISIVWIETRRVREIREKGGGGGEGEGGKLKISSISWKKEKEKRRNLKRWKEREREKINGRIGEILARKPNGLHKSCA